MLSLCGIVIWKRWEESYQIDDGSGGASAPSGAEKDAADPDGAGSSAEEGFIADYESRAALKSGGGEAFVGGSSPIMVQSRPAVVVKEIAEQFTLAPSPRSTPRIRGMGMDPSKSSPSGPASVSERKQQRLQAAAAQRGAGGGDAVDRLLADPASFADAPFFPPSPFALGPQLQSSSVNIQGGSGNIALVNSGRGGGGASRAPQSPGGGLSSSLR